jgi:hypothetical protein
MCMGFVKSFTGLIITRFFLGLMEGGLLVRAIPGVILGLILTVIL